MNGEMPESFLTRCVGLAVSLLVLIPAGCIPVKQARVAAVALTIEDVARAASKQSDPTIAREGTPAYLMLLDGLIEAYPQNAQLLTAGCQAYATYASSFLPDEERQASEAIYRKAKLYGFRALSGRGDFAQAASGSLEGFEAFLQQYKKTDVPALFWTASAWAGWIGTDVSRVESIGDLPMLEALLKRILHVDETYQYGGGHLFMGVLAAAKPTIMGGNLAKSKLHFDRAFGLGANRLLSAKVLFAEYYARATRDRSLYVKTLEEVLAARTDEIPELTLTNVLAKEKAKRLLEKTEEYFAQDS